MNTNRIDLLPQKSARARIREYYIRLTVVVLISVTILACVASVSITPTYLLISENLTARGVTLSGLKLKSTATDEREITARIASLLSYTNAVLALKNVSPASTLVASVLAIPRTGILISSMSYVSGSGGKATSLLLSGSATTRNTLRDYQIALGQSPRILSVDLPVSVYAKDTNIPFNMTLVLKP